MSDNLHFERDLAEGEQYQDFVAMMLSCMGRSYNLFTSRKAQMNVGESFGGLEIKYDRLLEQTRNVFIEIKAESKDKSRYIDGGVCKEDNATLYLIGNFTECWIFSKNQLKVLLTSDDEYDIKEKMHLADVGAIEYIVKSYAKGYLLKPKFLENPKYYVEHIVWKDSLKKVQEYAELLNPNSLTIRKVKKVKE